MSDVDDMAFRTCSEWLTIPQLKAICKHRGIRAQGSDKTSLVKVVAPRLLEPTSAIQALAGLDETWLVVLHRIAMDPSGVQLAELQVGVRWGLPTGPTLRKTYQTIARELLTRGVVLVNDDRQWMSSGERCDLSEIRLVVPKAHRPHLPPVPCRSAPMDSKPETRDPFEFARAVLAAAVARGRRNASEHHPELLRRVAARVRFDQCEMQLGDKPLRSAKNLMTLIRKGWATPKLPQGLPKAVRLQMMNARMTAAAEQVWTCLPRGHGVVASELGLAIERLCHPHTHDGLSEAVAQHCQDGYQAGFLARSGHGSRTRYAHAEGVTPADDGPIAFKTNEHGIQVDLLRTGLSALLDVTPFCEAIVNRGALHLRPDLIRASRDTDRFLACEALEPVVKVSPPFQEVKSRVRDRHGKLLVHEGIVVLRVEDLGLRTLLCHKLGDERIRTLGGAFLAVPEGELPEVSKLIRREGFSPRSVK